MFGWPAIALGHLLPATMEQGYGETEVVPACRGRPAGQGEEWGNGICREPCQSEVSLEKCLFTAIWYNASLDPHIPSECTGWEQWLLAGL